MHLPNWLKLIGAVLVAEGLGGLAGLVTAPAIPTWYAALAKPVFNPPDWLFAPAWTLLYALMGVAFFLVWRRGFAERRARVDAILFAVQFGLNLLWTVIFFGFQSPGAALVEILLLNVAIVATVVSFWRIDRWAAALLLPYFAWSLFATALNAAIVVLN